MLIRICNAVFFVSLADAVSQLIVQVTAYSLQAVEEYPGNKQANRYNNYFKINKSELKNYNFIFSVSDPEPDPDSGASRKHCLYCCWALELSL